MFADLAGIGDDFLIDPYHDGVITFRPFVCQERLYSRPEVGVIRARGAYTVKTAPNGISSDSNSQVSLEALLFPIVWDWMFPIRVEKSFFVSDGSFKFPIHERQLGNFNFYRLKRSVLVDDVG